MENEQDLHKCKDENKIYNVQFAYTLISLHKASIELWTRAYSCNENTMRGTAKSLATPPATLTMNVTRVNEVVDANVP